jgi:hypothetical protein
MSEGLLIKESADKGEIVIYQPDEITKLEVRLDNETVWLNRNQLAVLFDRDVKTIGKHIKNALTEELSGFSVVANFATTAADGKTYIVEYYNLEMILSIGYRVKSQRGIHFRRWANSVLKQYLLNGFAVNYRLNELEERIDRKLIKFDKRLGEQEKKMDIMLQGSMRPKQGIFFDGQIYDAYSFVSGLIRKAVYRIVLIDNYIDDTVLTMMDKRKENVEATIYTSKISKETKLDLKKHNAQYRPISVRQFSSSHDRFLIIDDAVYLIGASIKDLGKKWFGFTRMECISADEMIEKL